MAEGLGLVFDMDGVLVDSNPIHSQAWVAFNREYGLDTTESMRQSMYGKRNDEIIREFFGDGLTPGEIARRGAAKEALYRQMVGDNVERILVPGVKRFLEEHRDAPMAVASNAEPANVDFVLNRSGLRSYFRAVVDGHQVNRPKPYPDVYLRAARLLGIPPANCVIFEDSLSGVEAAHAAGARVVGLLTTHAQLPGVRLAIPHFGDVKLESWLREQRPV